MRIFLAGIAVDVVRAESARFRHPLLLIHGLWTGSWIWRGFAAYLAHRGWDAWAPSFLDGAASGTPADRLGQLVELCRTLPDPPVLLAHDAGAVTAAMLAARVGAPAIVAIAPLLPRVQGEPGILSWPQFWPARLFSHEVKPPRGRAARLFLGGLADEASRLRPDSGPWFRSLLSGAERFPDDPPCPGLVVCARGDPITSAIEGELLARRLDWSFDLGGTSGHFPMLAPGWEHLADDVHRWLVRTLGEKLLAFLGDDLDAE
jgi:pimeloyl-ACP methyl ester carboxylesterase